MLIFNEEKHTYTSVHNLNDKYISCSTIVGLFHKHFDRRYWGLYSALKNLEGDNFKGWKYLKEKTEDSILAILSPDWRNEALKERDRIWSEWDEKNLKSRIKGTAFHNGKEDEAILIGTDDFRGETWRTIDFKSTYLSMSIEELQNVNYYTDLEDGYYPELLLFSHELGIAGTSDKVYIKTIGKDRWVLVDDWKTNEVIKTENKYDRMLYPFLQLPDCNKAHYEVQIALYGYLLELMGFKVAFTSFTHVLEDGELVPYIIDYEKIKPLVILMLEEYRKALPQCKEYFNFLLHTDNTLQDYVEELINSNDNIEHGIETYKFDNEDEFKDNLMRYLCKSFIQENRQ